MALPEIVPLRERDLPAAAAALSRAFHDDPLQMYVFPDPVERAARSPALFTPLLRYGLLFGEVLTTAGGPEGAAVWLGPAAWEVTSNAPRPLGWTNCRLFLALLPQRDFYPCSQRSNHTTIGMSRPPIGMSWLWVSPLTPKAPGSAGPFYDQ